MAESFLINKKASGWRPQKTQMMKKNFISEIKINLFNSNSKLDLTFYLFYAYSHKKPANITF
ncbi:hypothetical protein DRF65_26095 [Chryseobacterium pennae]|uniref:Uncharacterized protein n=1 Tax=Chryseobacterium pennae TaxID=2258962 RepID=A0A3D9C0T2_9FLAO|nr:hypothetical protein DRF65_26095 [Chryseobacterium pennae]